MANTIPPPIPTDRSSKPPRGAGLKDYLKEAFFFRWNLLLFLGGLAAAAIGPLPDVTLPLVFAGELAYLGALTSLPRFRALMGPLLRTPTQGADTVVWLAAAPRALETNGQFWHDRRPRSVAPLPGTRTSDADAERCWNWCVDHAGVAALLEAVR